jgi:tripartite-type tricarboxylate transporter receptor subunit TctC
MILKLTAAVVFASLGFGASAQTYPTKPIKVVVGFPAGGYTDLVARVLGQYLAEELRQPVIVENRPGANAIIGTDYTAKSAPDGYTLLVTTPSHVVNPSLYAKLPYDTVADFAPVILVGIQPNVLVVPSSSALHSIKDVIALARSKPGQLTYASNGAGSSNHLSAVLFGSMAKVQMTHVPYKGSALAVPAIIAGQTDLFFGTASEVLTHVRAGKLRALGVTSRQRIPALPDVPTVAEEGLPGYEASAWFGYFAPAKTPTAIVNRLNSEINKGLSTPQVRERLSAQGTVLLAGGTPEQFAEFVNAELAKWAKVVVESGAKAD